MTNYLMSNESFFLPINNELAGKDSVYIYARDVESGQELAEQIGFFGYVTMQFSCAEALDTAIHNHSPHALVVLTPFQADFDSQDHEAALELIKTQADIIPTVYISSTESFDSRLEAIRGGGQAFFTYPVDIGELIGTLDDFTLPRKNIPFRVLILDHDVETASYYALNLEKVGMETRIITQPLYLLHPLNDFNPDLILMSFDFPDCNGLELAVIIRQMEIFVSVPILFVTTSMDQKAMLEAIAAGGDGFLNPPIRPDTLISMVTSRIERYRALRYRLNSDGLTGLLNHTALKETLKKEIIKTQHEHLPLCYAMIDLDNFKQINDCYGHAIGDRVLKNLARMLRQRLRKTDVIGRYGGEEFAVILINTTLEDGAAIMNRLRANFSKIHHYGREGNFKVTFSCGIAELETNWSADQISQCADNALYEAKNSGRNRVVKCKASASKKNH